MKYYIIIPAHNEESFLGLTLQSIIDQTILPSKIVVVNDNSTDKTGDITLDFAKNNQTITLVNKTSEAIHLPGSKVIQAFNKGLETVDDDYDFIVKADADLIFPPTYFETIINHFRSDDTIGMVGGFAYIEKNGNWILENLTDKDHIRGAFKAYRKATFKQMYGFRSFIYQSNRLIVFGESQSNFSRFIGRIVIDNHNFCRQNSLLDN